MLENKTKVLRKNIICWRANRFHKRSVTGEMNQVEVNGTEEQKKNYVSQNPAPGRVE